MRIFRASMCGDCLNINTNNCSYKGKVNKYTLRLSIQCNNFNSNKILKEKNYECAICGSIIPKNKVRCKCVFDGEYTD